MTLTSGRSQANANTKRLTLEEYLTYDDGTDTRYKSITSPTFPSLKLTAEKVLQAAK